MRELRVVSRNIAKSGNVLAGPESRATHRHVCRFCAGRAESWDDLAWHIRIVHPDQYFAIMVFARSPKRLGGAYDSRLDTEEQFLAAHEDDWDEHRSDDVEWELRTEDGDPDLLDVQEVA